MTTIGDVIKKRRKRNYYNCDLCNNYLSILDMELIRNIKGTSYRITKEDSEGSEKMKEVNRLIICTDCVRKKMPRGWKVYKIKNVFKEIHVK